MNTFANAFLLTYAGLFPVVDPVGNVPIFLSLTQGHTARERALMARRIAVASLLLLLGSMVVGSHVLEFFGISLPAVRVGGGLVVTALGWRLLNSGVSIEAEATAQAPKPKPLDTFYPLTMPLTVGPGSMSVAIALGSQRPFLEDVPRLALLAGGALMGLVALSMTVYLCYRYSEAIIGRLGPGGTNVLVRLSAFILLCIGIQIIWNGWIGLQALPR